MYRCHVCGAIAPPRTPSYQVVVETRERRYPCRPGIFPPAERAKRKHKDKWKDDPGGAGREIVREVRACPTCAGRRPEQPAEPAG